MISIITPYRNARRFLPGLTDTLQAQTHRDWECLLVDHGSSDGGGALAADLVANDARFRCLVLASPDVKCVCGPAMPRNLALDQRRGEWLCFLDVDDRWHPQKLERQLAFHRRHNLDLSVTAYGRCGMRDRDFLTVRCPPSILPLARLQRSNELPMLTVMLRSALLDSWQGQPSLRFRRYHHEDYGLWLRLWRQQPHLRYGCLPELLAVHFRHGTNLTAKRLLTVSWLYQMHRADGRGPLQAAGLSLHTAAIRLCCTALEQLGWRRIALTAQQALDAYFEPAQWGHWQ